MSVTYRTVTPGWPEADARAKDIVAFETQIAQASWTKAQQRDPVATYNPVTTVQLEKLAPKVVERDERIAEARRRAEGDRRDANTVGDEVTALYGDSDELLKHARVVDLVEIGLLQGHRRQRVAAARSLGDVVALVTERRGDCVDDRGLVVDDEDAAGTVLRRLCHAATVTAVPERLL